MSTSWLTCILSRIRCMCPRSIAILCRCSRLPWRPFWRRRQGLSRFLRRAGGISTSVHSYARNTCIRDFFSKSPALCKQSSSYESINAAQILNTTTSTTISNIHTYICSTSWKTVLTHLPGNSQFRYMTPPVAYSSPIGSSRPSAGKGSGRRPCS